MSEYAEDDDLLDWLEAREAEDRGGEIFTAAPAPAIPAAPPIAPGWHPRSSHEIFAAPFEMPKSLCPALEITAGRPVGIVGGPGAGKNDTAQALALAVITGGRAFEIFPCTRGRVLHLTWDLGYDATRLRYRQLAAGMGLAPQRLADEGMLTLCVYPVVTLATENARKEFAAVMRGFDLCILDNARAASPGLEENDSRFAGVLTIYGEAAQAAGCVPLYLHHARKSGGEGIDAIRGSGAIAGASGAIWLVEGAGAAPRRVIHARQGDFSRGVQPDFWLRHAQGGRQGVFDLGDELSPIRLLGSHGEPEETDLAARVVVAVRAAPGASASEVVRTVGANRAQTLAMIRTLCEGHVLRREGPGLFADED